MKKLFILILSVICVTLFASGSFVSADSIEKQSIANFGEEYLIKSTESMDNHKVMMKLLIEEAKSQNSKEKLPNEYSGSFINEDGNLVISFSSQEASHNFKLKLDEKIKESKTKDADSTTVSSEIIYMVQDYSYSELDMISDELSDQYFILNIISVGIKQATNKVEITVYANTDIEAIIDFLNESIDNFTQDSIEFIVDLEVEYTTAYYAYSGGGIYYKLGLFNLFKSYGTVGFNAVDLSTGKLGVVTNSHVAAEGETMYYYNGKAMGQASKRIFGGEADAAFIPFTNTSTVTWLDTYEAIYDDGDSLTYLSTIGVDYYIVEGAPTYKIGYTSDYTSGVVLYTSYSVTVDGTVYTNVLKYSNQTLPGDSGGPVWISYGTRGATHILIAINFAAPSDGSYGVGCRVTSIMAALNVLPILTTNYYLY
ncbi:MAG: S1 family peptidase [Firmicutes bacterium]|nr:S1 family peptidase [Bacillota bacterium]